MPSNYPRAPLPLLAILAAPITWLYGRPDLFDSYRSAHAALHANAQLVNALQHGCKSVALPLAGIYLPPSSSAEEACQVSNQAKLRWCRAMRP